MKDCLVVSLVFLSCCALLDPTPARAADDAPSEASDTAREFADAVKVFKAGKAAAALPHFEHVAASTKSPNAQLYVGYCLMDLERPRDAHKAFSLTIRYALLSKDSRYEAAREAAQEQVLGLNLRLAKLVLSFVDAPPSLQVFVDDEAVPTEELGSALVLEPGLHRIRAAAEGVQPIRREETIEAGGSKTLTLSFDKNPEKVGLEPHPLAEPHPAGGTLRMLGFVSGGVAVMGLSVFAITGLKASSIHEKLERECPRGCSDADHLDLVGSGKSMQTVANVSLTIGAVSAAASATLLYFGYQKRGRAEPSIAIQGDGLTLHYRGTF